MCVDPGADQKVRRLPTPKRKQSESPAAASKDGADDGGASGLNPADWPSLPLDDNDAYDDEASGQHTPAAVVSSEWSESGGNADRDGSGARPAAARSTVGAGIAAAPSHSSEKTPLIAGDGKAKKKGCCTLL